MALGTGMTSSLARSAKPHDLCGWVGEGGKPSLLLSLLPFSSHSHPLSPSRTVVSPLPYPNLSSLTLSRLFLF